MKCMKCLLLLVALSVIGQAGYAGKWQGIKQKVVTALQATPLSKKIVGGVAVATVGATLLTAPLSGINAHNQFTEIAKETRANYKRRYAEAASKAAGFEVTEKAVNMPSGEQFYNDLQMLRRLADLELLATFGVFKVDPSLVRNVERIIDSYETLVQLRREGSTLVDHFATSLVIAVGQQYDAVAIFHTKAHPSAKMIPSSLEKLHLQARADLWQLTDQYVLQVISHEDYLTNKQKFLAQVKKDIDAKKRYRIRSMTRTSRFGGYRK